MTTNRSDDVRIAHIGQFLVGFTPVTPAAHRWLRENLDGQNTWFGGELIVELRYVENLAVGMANDGLMLKWMES